MGRSWFDAEDMDIEPDAGLLSGPFSGLEPPVFSFAFALPPTAPSGSSVTASPGTGVPTRDGVPAAVLASLSISKSEGSRSDEEAPPVFVRAREEEEERLAGEAERRTAEVRVRDSAASWESMSPMWDSRTPLRRENIVCACFFSFFLSVCFLGEGRAQGGSMGGGVYGEVVGGGGGCVCYVCMGDKCVYRQGSRCRPRSAGPGGASGRQDLRSRTHRISLGNEPRCV